MNRGRLPMWAVILSTLFTIALAGLGGALQSAAQGTPVAGASFPRVEAEAPWVVDAVVSQGDTQVVKIDGAFANVLIGSFPVNTPVEEADAALVGPFAGDFDDVDVIETGVSGGVPYTLNIVTIDGAEYGVFSLYFSRTARGGAEGYVYLAPVSRFAEGFTEAKANISVDDTPIFGGVEGAGLQNVLERNAGPASVPAMGGPPLASASATPGPSPEATPAR